MSYINVRFKADRKQSAARSHKTKKRSEFGNSGSLSHILCIWSAKVDWSITT